MSELYCARNTGWWMLRDLLAADKEWHNSSKSFRGIKVDWQFTTPHYGQLPDFALAVLKWDIMNVGVDYCVYSYQTPIGWRVTVDGQHSWYVPEWKYSNTTSKHQSKLATAVSVLCTESDRHVERRLTETGLMLP